MSSDAAGPFWPRLMSLGLHPLACPCAGLWSGVVAGQPRPFQPWQSPVGFTNSRAPASLSPPARGEGLAPGRVLARLPVAPSAVGLLPPTWRTREGSCKATGCPTTALLCGFISSDILTKQEHRHHFIPSLPLSLFPSTPLLLRALFSGRK